MIKSGDYPGLGKNISFIRLAVAWDKQELLQAKAIPPSTEKR
jgi:hypothetical protein